MLNSFIKPQRIVVNRARGLKSGCAVISLVLNYAGQELVELVVEEAVDNRIKAAIGGAEGKQKFLQLFKLRFADNEIWIYNVENAADVVGKPSEEEGQHNDQRQLQSAILGF